MIVLDGITLPGDLLWTDEFAAHPVAQSVRHTLDGGIAVFYTLLAAGRPISLESQADAGWLTRVQVEAIAQRAASPGGVFSLLIRDVPYRVMFRHHDAPAFEAKPLVHLARAQPSDCFLASLKFLTV